VCSCSLALLLTKKEDAAPNVDSKVPISMALVKTYHGGAGLLPSNTNLRRRALQSLEDGALQGAAFATYSAAIRIGSQHFQVRVDTGSTSLVVSNAPMFNNLAHGPDICRSYYSPRCEGRPISMAYGSQHTGGGSILAGRVCNSAEFATPRESLANITFAGAFAGSPPFVGILKNMGVVPFCNGFEQGHRHGGMTIPDINSQGIAGMAYSKLTPTYPPSIFDSIVATSGIQDVFAMQCCGWTGTDVAGNGMLTLGGYDSSLHTGRLQYTPITRETYYCVHMTSPSSTISAASSEIEESCATIIDSGTSGLYLTTGIFARVDAGIKLALANAGIHEDEVQESDLHLLPCIILQFEGGVTLSVPPQLYYQPYPPGTERAYYVRETQGVNIIGQVVMEAYYTVFDRQNKRIGFAPIAGCGLAQPDDSHHICSGSVPDSVPRRPFRGGLDET